MPKEGFGGPPPANPSFWYDKDKDVKACFLVTKLLYFGYIKQIDVLGIPSDLLTSFHQMTPT